MLRIAEMMSLCLERRPFQYLQVAMETDDFMFFFKHFVGVNFHNYSFLLHINSYAGSSQTLFILVQISSGVIVPNISCHKKCFTTGTIETLL